MIEPRDPVLADGDPGQVLFRLVRLLSRQPGGRTSAGQQGDATRQRMASIQVVQAVAACKDEVTIGDVAEYLRVDKSTASRLVSDTLKSGFVESRQSERDARRTTLRLSAAGADLLAGARAYQQLVFRQATQDWPEVERDTFARLLIKFAHCILDT